MFVGLLCLGRGGKASLRLRLDIALTVDPAGDYGIVGVRLTSEVLVQAMASMPQLLGCVIKGLQGLLKVYCLSQVILRCGILPRVVLGVSGRRLVLARQGL